MKQLLTDFYWEAMRELEKIQKGKLKISERVALEKAIVHLEAIKKTLGYVDVTTKS